MAVQLMNKSITDVAAVGDTYAARLTDEIIDVASELGIELSATDVSDVAIYTLHSIITATGNAEITGVKKSICETIGDVVKIADYFNITLGGISATNDAIADEKLSEYHAELEKQQQLEMV